MFARQFARSVGSPAIQHLQRRGHSAVAGPPQVKVSFAEKVVHGAIMFTGWFFIPVWVLTHMREYKGQNIDSKQLL
ncbi:hypothetical protein PVAND_003831 [Polypedilum vanderplanki]|uniref:Uncharacterized protein n=1 Tax=Polypedilum vanderplanki TaxID=319348 RepID=A0A9J6BV84_POLVA|nr:hypothetical protein PVAND_003831 [Polypedilum vanderplanki]